MGQETQILQSHGSTTPQDPPRICSLLVPVKTKGRVGLCCVVCHAELKLKVDGDVILWEHPKKRTPYCPARLCARCGGALKRKRVDAASPVYPHVNRVQFRKQCEWFLHCQRDGKECKCPSPDGIYLAVCRDAQSCSTHCKNMNVRTKNPEPYREAKLRHYFKNRDHYLDYHDKWRQAQKDKLAEAERIIAQKKPKGRRGRPSKVGLFKQARALNLAGRTWPQCAEILLPNEVERDGRSVVGERLRKGVSGLPD